MSDTELNLSGASIDGADALSKYLDLMPALKRWI